jgi:tetratricopeptide (TPR) repeat protein
VRVPNRLLSIVTRGLRPVPGDRHPSMEALVDALERVRGARARRTRWAIGGTALSAALLVGNQVAVMAAPVPCENAEAGLGTAWDDARRQAVAAAWPAGTASEQVDALAAVDAWASEWGAQRREVCEATRVREEQSELAYSLRMACLDRMATRVGGLTEELAERGGGEPSAALVRAELPSLAQCEDVETLDRLVNRFSDRSMYDDAEQDRAWAEADALLVRADTRQRLGRPDVEGLAERARELGRHHGLVLVEAKALRLLADVRTSQGDAAQATTLLDRALRLSVVGGDDESAIDLILGQAEAALAAGRPDDATLHLSYFEAFVARARDAQMAAVYRDRGAAVTGRVHAAKGAWPLAIETLAPLADDPELDIRTRIAALGTLGLAHKELGERARAIDTWVRLSELVVAEHGADSPDLVQVLNNLAVVRLDDQEPEAALEDLQRAEAITTRALGAQHPFMAAILTNQGVAERQRGRLPEARALQERSLALRLRIHGDTHPSLAHALDELAELARLAGDHASALAHLDRALRVREGSLGLEHPLVADTLTLQARVHLDRGEPEQARATLDRALAIVGREGVDPVDRAEVELLLAKAMEGRDLAAAREWATTARARAEAAGTPGEAVRDQARAWLRDRASADGR